MPLLCRMSAASWGTLSGQRQTPLFDQQYSTESLTTYPIHIIHPLYTALVRLLHRARPAEKGNRNRANSIWSAEEAVILPESKSSP